MRRAFIAFIVLGIAAYLLLASPPTVQAYDYSYARIVRVSYVEGDVQVSRPGQQDWEKAVVNLPIQQGFTVATTNGGRAEIEFENGATARIAENSVLQFTELALSAGGRITRLTLAQGTATFYANPKRDDTFVVLTPQLQVTATDNTHFRLDVFNDGSSVSVFKGKVDVDSSAGTRRVEKGQTLAYSTPQADNVQIERNPTPDDWDRWVADRADAINTARTNTYRYTRAPFSYGLADLTSYGGWYYVSGYGYAWQPWGIAAGWMPFFNGFWQFYPGLGWTWISYEPWGWVPYHFGRWVYTAGFGWVWLPGYFNYWSPATVYWVQTPTGIGWAPLPPNTAIGQTPPAPTRGPIVTNTLIGIRKSAPNGILQPNGHVHVRPAGPDLNGNFAETAAMGVSDSRGGLPAPSAPAGTNPPAGSSAFSGAGSVLVPVRPGLIKQGPGMVFDHAERTFVNHPAAPTGSPAIPATTPPAPAVKAPSNPVIPPLPPKLSDQEVNPPRSPTSPSQPPRTAPPAPPTPRPATPPARPETPQPAPQVSAPRPPARVAMPTSPRVVPPPPRTAAPPQSFFALSRPPSPPSTPAPRPAGRPQ